MAARRDIQVGDLLATWLTLPPNLKNDTQIATLVVKHFMGLPWIDKHLDPSATNVGPLTLSGTSRDIELAKIRIVDLAESLFNLRKISGIEECIAHLANAENPEPALAELHIGKMLYANDWDFRFVTPQGRRGDNYDFKIQYEGFEVCADAKC